MPLVDIQVLDNTRVMSVVKVAVCSRGGAQGKAPK